MIRPSIRCLDKKAAWFKFRCERDRLLGHFSTPHHLHLFCSPSLSISFFPSLSLSLTSVPSISFVLTHLYCSLQSEWMTEKKERRTRGEEGEREIQRDVAGGGMWLQILQNYYSLTHLKSHKRKRNERASERTKEREWEGGREIELSKHSLFFKWNPSLYVISLQTFLVSSSNYSLICVPEEMYWFVPWLDQKYCSNQQ